MQRVTARGCRSFFTCAASCRGRTARVSTAGWPRGRDFGAIRERLERGRPAVQRASWRAYDSFLKANRVDEGIRSYDDIVSLVIGIATDADGRPRRRDE